MPYGILKADTLTYYTATGDVSIAISGLAISGSPLISGVSGIFTTSVSGATVTGDAGQFTTITGGTAQFTNITGVSGTFTSRISGATVTGTSGQFTTLTATTGVFTSVSGGTVSGDVGLFNTISGNQGVFNSSLSVPSGTAASPSISFNGDPNTGIYSSGADAVAISTGGSGRLFVDASGRVGVGTNSPSSLLHINNTSADPQIRITSAAATTGFTIDSVGGSINFNNRENNPLAFLTNDSERLRITAAGLVGIGTSAPGSTLHCNSTSAADVYLRTSNSAATSGFDVGVSSGAIAYVFNRNNTDLRFGTNGAERVTISAGGNVGIGTTSPSSKLSIQVSPAGSGSDGIFLTDGTRVLQLIQTGSSYSYNGVGANENLIYASQNPLSLLADGQPIKFCAGTSEKARIDTSGRLLVGTSTARSNFFGTALSAVTQTEGTGGAAGRGALSVINNDVSNNPPYVLLGRSGAATLGSNAAVVSGSRLGTLTFHGADGTSFIEAATVAGEVDGTPGTNDMPGRLVFSTTADGASSPTERVRISQNGVVTVKNGAVAEIGTLADGATVTPDFAANCNFTLAISGNRTLANPTNITAGQTGSIFIIQGTGSNALSWGSYWDFTGGTAPTLSTASGAVDRVDYVVRTSTSIHTVFTANYS